MRPYGFYWWRGRVLALHVRQDGAVVALVPKDLVPLWRRDRSLGRVRL